MMSNPNVIHDMYDMILDEYEDENNNIEFARILEGLFMINIKENLLEIIMDYNMNTPQLLN